MRIETSAVLILAFFACATLADDLIPPPWERYQGDTKYASWSFTEEPSGAGETYPPDSNAFPNTGVAHIWSYPNVFWSAELDGRNGYLQSDGWTLFKFDNPQPLDIYVQTVYHESGEIPEIYLCLEGSMFADYDIELTHEMDLGENWWYRRFHVTMERYTGESGDLFGLMGASVFDQIIIDTPEPNSCLLFAVGVLTITIRRRKYG